jgi:hypothetical protein
MTAGFFRQLLLISQFELKRGFATRKGLLSVVTFVVVWYFILLYPLRFAADLLIQEKGMTHNSSFLEFIGFGSLQHWPIPEFGVYWQIALLTFPMLSITVAADQTSSDRERGTLRFIVLRSSRDGLFFGRFAGAMAIQAILICATALSILGLVLYRDVSLLPSALQDFAVIFVNVILAVMPFTAMMAALSVKVKSARQATLWAILIWTFLAGIISGFANYVPALDVFKLLIPGYQLSELAQRSEWQTLNLANIPFLQSFVLLALGRWIMMRQAL